MTDQKPSETPAEYGRRYDEQIDRLQEAIEDLKVEVVNGGSEVRERFETALTDLRLGLARLGKYTTKIRNSSEDAWHDLREAAEEAFSEFESNIATARADLRAELAPDIAAYRTAATAEAEAWRQRLEQLKQQSKEAGAQTRERVDALDDAYHRAKLEFGTATESTGEALGDLKARVGEVVADLRKAVRDFSDSKGPPH